MVTNLKFNGGFTHEFLFNTLTLTPEPVDPILAGDGITVSGMTVTNAKPMCDVVVFQDWPSNLTEVHIPAEQLTSIAFRGSDYSPTALVLELTKCVQMLDCFFLS